MQQQAKAQNVRSHHDVKKISREVKGKAVQKKIKTYNGVSLKEEHDLVKFEKKESTRKRTIVTCKLEPVRENEIADGRIKIEEQYQRQLKIKVEEGNRMNQKIGMTEEKYM